MWLIYESADEETQIFMGIFLIAAILLVLGVATFEFLKTVWKKWKK